MVSFDDLMAGTCDLLGLNAKEIGSTRFAAIRRAISNAIQLAWGYNWWPGTVVRRHMLPGITYPGPLWRGVLTFYPDAGKWYQYLDNQYRTDPPAIKDSYGVWQPNLPYWAEYSLEHSDWSATVDYAAGSRVRHGGRFYVASQAVSAGNAPGGNGTESAKWVPVPYPAPFVYMHQAPYPPVGRVRGLWRSPHRGWQEMQWSDITNGALLFVIGHEDEQYGWRVYDDLADPSQYANAVLEYQARFPNLVGTVYDPSKAYRPPHWPLLTNAPAPKVATPTFSPSAGDFESSVSVSISTATPGATIHYTLDGSTPTEASPTYTGPITLTTTTTVKAIGVKAGLTNSDVASKTYSKARLVYWGASASTVLDGAGILALPYQVFRSTPAGSYTFPDNAPPKYLFLAWPDDGPQPVATTGFTSSGIPMTGDFAGAAEGYDQTQNGWPYKLVTVNGKPHRLYRTLYQMELSVTIVVSV